MIDSGCYHQYKVNILYNYNNSPDVFCWRQKSISAMQTSELTTHKTYHTTYKENE